jgi:hypothetical protein
MAMIVRSNEEYLDAQEQAAKTPETFYAPSAEELGALGAGSLVKVCTGAERFWTIIETLEGDTITAKIDNELTRTDIHGLKCDDLIQFEKRHIYQIYRK